MAADSSDTGVVDTAFADTGAVVTVIVDDAISDAAARDVNVADEVRRIARVSA